MGAPCIQSPPMNDTVTGEVGSGGGLNDATAPDAGAPEADEPDALAGGGAAEAGAPADDGAALAQAATTNAVTAIDSDGRRICFSPIWISSLGTPMPFKPPSAAPLIVSFDG